MTSSLTLPPERIDDALVEIVPQVLQAGGALDLRQRRGAQESEDVAGDLGAQRFRLRRRLGVEQQRSFEPDPGVLRRAEIGDDRREDRTARNWPEGSRSPPAYPRRGPSFRDAPRPAARREGHRGRRRPPPATVTINMARAICFIVAPVGRARRMAGLCAARAAASIRATERQNGFRRSKSCWPQAGCCTSSSRPRPP